MTRARSFLMGFGVLCLGEALAKLFTLAAFARLARTLGPAVFGRLDFCFALVFVLSIVVDSGAGVYGARETARGVRSDGEIARDVLAWRFWSMALSGLLLGAYAFATPQPDAIRSLLLLFGISLLPIPYLFQWSFLGHHWMHLVSLAQVVRYGVFAAVTLGWVRQAPDVWKVAVAEAVGVLAASGCTILCFRSRMGFWPPCRPAFPSWKLAGAIAPLALSHLMWVLKYTFMTTLVGIMAGLGANAAQVGQFGSAVRLIVALHMFVALYFNNLLPWVSQVVEGPAVVVQSLVGGALHLATWTALLATTLIAVAAEPIVRLLYGPAFAPSVIVLQVGVWMLAASAISSHFRVTLIAAGRQGLEMASTAAGAFAAIILMIVLFPRFGLVGAAAAMVSGEVATLALSYALMRRTVLPLTIGRWIWAPLAMVVAALFLVVAGGGLQVWARGSLVVAAFVVAATLLDRSLMVRIGEFRQQLFQRRPGLVESE